MRICAGALFKGLSMALMQVLRGRCDHRERNLRRLANAAHDVVGRNADHPRPADGLGRRRIDGAREGHCFGEAVAAREHMDDRLLARQRHAIELDPAADHDEERRRGVALSEQGLALVEIDGYGGCDDAGDDRRFQATVNGDLGDDLQILGPRR